MKNPFTAESAEDAEKNSALCGECTHQVHKYIANDPENTYQDCVSWQL